MIDQTAIVILNYNGRKHLETYLPGVIEYSPCSIYIIDNASTDDSISFLKDNFPSVKLIINDKNHGFAGGYNLGLQKVNEPYLVLLNSDIKVTPNWLTKPLECLSNDKVAAVQPKILSIKQPQFFEHAGASGGFLDRYGFPFCRGRVFDNAEKDLGQYNTREEIFWATGACLFIKRNLFFEAGEFDYDFFAHMEEIDLCWRLKNMGYKIMVEPASTVYHLGGGTLQYSSPLKTKLNFRNNLFLLQKNLFKNRFPILFWRMILDGVAAMKFLLTGYGKHFWAVFMAHLEFYKGLSKMKKKRNAFSAKRILKSNQLTGKINRNIVWQYFVKGRKKYTDLLP